MTARSRPRGPPVKDDDAHEERNMWSQIVTDLKRLKTVHGRAMEVSKAIVEAEEKLSTRRSSVPSIRQIDEIQDLYREGLKLAEEEQKILNDDPHGVIQNISLLSALRSASEAEPPRAAAANVKSRSSAKRKLDAFDGGSDSPALSPNTASSATVGHARLKGAGVRSGSVPYTPKDGKDGAAKADDGSSNGTPAVTDKMDLLVKGAEVAYKQGRQKGAEGDWIQCIINAVSGEGKNKRYEVQDPEPDENGAQGQVYRAAAPSLVPIPPSGAVLPDFPKGKQVLARYPDTTTFYRAEVMGMKRDACRLKFEGEEEIGKEMDVDRRFVLDYSGR
ncbi:MAG: SAGA HAT/Core module component [Lichina confinis]|nr:MAG: SAGA HAT/Core module component [Lichina confinis]